MDKPFEDNEKRYMLAEMIKASRIDVAAVVEFIKGHSIQPNWMDMRYPHGRTPNECRQVAESMGIAAPPLQQPQPAAPQQYQQQFCQPPQHVQQQQQQHLQHQKQHHQRVLQPSQLATPLPPLKRKSSFESTESIPKRLAMATAETTMPLTRALNIQPRPSPRPSPTGFAAAPSWISESATPSPSNTYRKRGRPSKADREARVRASQSIGALPPLLAPAPKQDRAPTSTPPPLAENSPLPTVTSIGVTSRASSELKDNLGSKDSTMTRHITTRLSEKTGREPEDEQKGRYLYKDPGPGQGTRNSAEEGSALLRTKTSTLLQKSAKSFALQELQANNSLELPENKSSGSRIVVATFLETGIPAL